MLILIAALLCQGDYSPDPYVVFQRTDSVLAGIENVSYSFTFRGTGALRNIIPEVEGEAVLREPNGASHPLMRLDFTTMVHPGAIPEFRVPVTYIAAPESLYRIDHDRMTITSGAPLEAAVFDYPPSAVLMEFVLESPFSDEMNAESIAVLYPETLDGVLCHVFTVHYGAGLGESLWYIGMDDYLPRAVERIDYYGERETPGGQRLELSGIVAGSETAEFTADVYRGYRRLGPLALVEPGELAEGLLLAGLDGFVKRIDFPGDQPVLLCFFSSWDPVSLQALGVLNDAAEDGMTDTYAVSIWETSDPSTRLQGLDMGFTVLTHGADAAEDYGVVSVPSLILVGADGRVVYSTDDPDRMNWEDIPGV